MTAAEMQVPEGTGPAVCGRNRRGQVTGHLEQPGLVALTGILPGSSQGEGFLVWGADLGGRAMLQ